MSLRNSAIRGVVWTGIGTVGAGLLNFILTMVLARVLSPSDFGLLELLAIFTVLSECFIDSGFSQAIIRDRDASQTDLSSVFYFNLIIAIILYAVLFFCAPLIAVFYHEDSLVDLSRFVFLVIIFYSCSIIQNAIFSKSLNFKPLAIASISSIVIAGCVAIIMAVNGFGVWALAANLVLFAFIKMLFLWLLSTWRPSLQVSKKSIKKYFGFGVNLLVQGLIDKFVTNMESLMIGRIYTKESLGYFSQARKFDSYIAQTSTSVIQKVTYPILGKIGDNIVSLKRGYRRVLGITMYAMVPILFFVAASADNMLFVFFGPQWEESIPYLRLWSLCGLLLSFHSIFINIFLVTNNPRLLLIISTVKQAIRLAIILSLIRISVLALMYGIVGVGVFSAIIYCYFGGRLIGYRISEVLKDLFPTVSIALLGALIVFFLGQLLTDNNHYLVLMLQAFVMIGVVWLGSVLTKNDSYKEVKDIVWSFYSAHIKK